VLCQRVGTGARYIQLARRDRAADAMASRSAMGERQTFPVQANSMCMANSSYGVSPVKRLNLGIASPPFGGHVDHDESVLPSVMLSLSTRSNPTHVRTPNVLAAARQSNAKRFVNISTVRPPT
jgi:hypothetical protein